MTLLELKHMKKMKKLEVIGEMKKINLILVLVLALVVMFTTAAFAAAKDPQPAADESYSGDGTKNTTITESTNPAANDNEQLANNDGTDIVYGSNTDPNTKFYLPDGVPSAGANGRIHSNYSKNTDACAACHFTHTALGKRLLQWESIYKTCAACHDGSLGDWTYDVYGGFIGTNSPATNDRTFGGLFTTSPGADTSSLSTHMPDGYMSLAAAPGNTGIDNYLAGSSFDCISCHTPHGQGGNARILSPDPGKEALGKFFGSFADANSTNRDAYLQSYVVELTDTTDSVYYGNNTDAGHWIQGYPYNRLTKVGLVATGAVKGTGYVVKFDAAGNVVLDANNDGTNDAWLTSYNVDWRKGKVYGVTVPSGQKLVAVRVPGIFVKMAIDNYMQDSEAVTYISESNPNSDQAKATFEGINAYCGACHNKYNTEGATFVNEFEGFGTSTANANHGSGSNLISGDNRYRHQVGFAWNKQWTGEAQYVKFAVFDADKNYATTTDQKDIFTCLGCHFAHGTNEGYWNDYITSKTGGTTAAYGGGETFGSSALKRLPNMGICENCHDKKSGNDGAGQVYTD